MSTVFFNFKELTHTFKKTDYYIEYKKLKKIFKSSQKKIWKKYNKDYDRYEADEDINKCEKEFLEGEAKNLSQFASRYHRLQKSLEPFSSLRRLLAEKFNKTFKKAYQQFLDDFPGYKIKLPKSVRFKETVNIKLFTVNEEEYEEEKRSLRPRCSICRKVCKIH